MRLGMGNQYYLKQVFGGGLDQEQERYCTYDEAEAGHKIMCERVFKSLQGYPK